MLPPQGRLQRAWHTGLLTPHAPSVQVAVAVPVYPPAPLVMPALYPLDCPATPAEQPAPQYSVEAPQPAAVQLEPLWLMPPLVQVTVVLPKPGAAASERVLLA